MKKVFKIIAYGIVGLIGLAIGVLIATFPSLIAKVTDNEKWLWLYTPHILGIMYFAGYIIYNEIDD